VRSFLKVPRLFDSCCNLYFILAIRTELILVECGFRECDKCSRLGIRHPACEKHCPEPAHRQCPFSKNGAHRCLYSLGQPGVLVMKVAEEGDRHH
jgi:hypothetical protein